MKGLLALAVLPHTWISLATLTALEIVLGIDNIVILTILVGRLPRRQQRTARLLGLSLALFFRLGLLFTLSWIMSLRAPFFSLLGRSFSGRDLILIGGGLFLVAKSTHEIYAKLEKGDEESAVSELASATRFGLILAQIIALDIVFSLDSVITAVGMAQHVAIMVVAMVIAVLTMMVFAGRIGDFINAHPSISVLALSFLLLIGVLLMADGLGQHVDKGYVYFAMAFSLLVQLLNIRMTKKRAPVHLHTRYSSPPEGPGAGS